MNNIKLIDLLGEPATMPGVQHLLADLKVKVNDIKFTHDKFTAFAVNKKLGVELDFQKDFVVLEYLNDCSEAQSVLVEEKIKKMKGHPEGTLFLTCIAMTNNSLLDNGYDINYPIRLGETSISELSNMLGQPLATNDFFCTMAWNIEGQMYRIVYDETTLKIRQINFPFLAD